MSIVQSALLFGVAFSATAAAPGEITRLTVGISGQYKLGVWTEVAVEVRSGDDRLAGRLSLLAPDDEAIPVRYFPANGGSLDLPPRETREVRFCIRIGRPAQPLVVELHGPAGEVVLQRSFLPARSAPESAFGSPLDALRRWMVLVAPADPGVARWLVQGATAQAQPILTDVDAIQKLPTNPCGYEGIDTVVIFTRQPDTLLQTPQNRAAWDALLRWTQRGGRVLLSAGSNAAPLLTPEQPLSRLAPGRFTQMRSLRQLPSLETYVASSLPLPLPREGHFRVPDLSSLSGAVEARQGEVPLVVRAARNFGTVTWVAVDLDASSVTGWKSRHVLAARLLGLGAATPVETAGPGRVMHFGFADLGGQLRKALSQFPGVELVSFWLVAVIIAVYGLLVGPLDYFVVRRIFGKLIFTWLTFPTSVIVVALLALGLLAVLRKTDNRVNQAEVIDFDTQSQSVRGTFWAGLFSPIAQTYQLSAPPALPPPMSLEAADVRLGWWGLAGSGLGGMSPEVPTLGLGIAGYATDAALDRLADVPLPAGSSRHFTTSWNARAPAPLEAALREEDTLLVGTLTHRFPVPLEGCLLAFRHWVHELGTVVPNRSVTIGPALPRSELRTFLTNRRPVFTASKDKYHEESAPFDPSSLDPAYILRAMLFYEAAGGYSYTALWPGQWRNLDFTALLQADQAVVVARLPAGTRASRLEQDGRSIGLSDDPSVVFIRCILPVQTGPRNPR